MAQVDPRLQQIPKTFLSDFGLRTYFEELERFLHDLWVRTGAGNDIVADNETINTGDNALMAQVSVLMRQVSDINMTPIYKAELAELRKRLDDIEAQL